MNFQCPCSYKAPMYNEQRIIAHIEHCQAFNEDSPLCRMMNRANFDTLEIDQLVTVKYDLQIQLKRITAALKDKGYQAEKDEPNLSHYSRYTESAIRKPNGISKSSTIQQEHNGNGNGYANHNGTLLEEEQQPIHMNQSIVISNHQDPLVHTPPLVSPQRPVVAPTLIVEEQPQEAVKDSKLACESCHKAFYANADFNKIWYLDQCCHLVCKICITNLCNKFYVEKEGRILCPEIGCGSKITPYDLQQVLGHDKFQQFDNDLAMKNQNLVECCKCKEVFSFEKGSAAEQIKDNSGKQITGAELLHYANNRFKCPKCTTEQCKSCKATPYHVNSTCEAFATNKQSKKCRLCESPTVIDLSKPQAIQLICNQEDCQKRSKQLCTLKLACGHFCCASKDEQCLCLNQECSKSNQSEDDYCNLCFTEALKSAPCVKSTCGHLFHEECLLKRLQSKWNGPRIVFNYCLCPLCKAWLKVGNKQISEILAKTRLLQETVQILCNERMEIEKMQKAKELTDPKHQFYKKPEEFAMHVFCYYECFKCKKPYYGGLKNCQAAAEQDNRREFNKEDLICPECCPITFENKCPKHGVKYIEFKCRFCCAVALWFCGGTTHYCEPCHSGVNPLQNKVCPGPEKCPLGVKHKPNGQECSLGCALCRAKRVDDIKKQNE